MFLRLLILLLSFLPSWINTEIPLDFRQLAKVHNDPQALSAFNQQKVQIRGFLYLSSNEKVFLASEPDLKSCCVASASKRQGQIEVHEQVQGQIASSIHPGFAVLLEGIFALDQDGQFHLDDAYMIQEKNKMSDHLFSLLGIAVLAPIAAVLFFRRKRAYHQIGIS